MTAQAICSQRPSFTSWELTLMHGILQSCSRKDRLTLIKHQHSILIVEDENLVAWDMEQTLRDHDFHDVIVSSSLRGARKLMKSVVHKFSLVILDLKLGDGDARVLIDEFTDRGIAVIVMTGYSDFAHPFVPVLHKPFASSEIIQTIHSLLNSRH
jgi:DNA-binding NtrC family response regulator